MTRAEPVNVHMSVGPSYVTRVNDPIYAEFESVILNASMPYSAYCTKMSNATVADATTLLPEGYDWSIVRSARNGILKPWELMLATTDRIYVLIETSTSGRVEVSVTSLTAPEARDMADKVMEKVPAVKVANHIVDTHVWHLTSTGPTSTIKKITAESWDEVKDNYTDGVREALATMMRYRRPEGMGKIALWHGPPGTGKTTVLRTLAREWKDWCSFHYISDPEKFFAEPAYLMEVAASDYSVEVPITNDGDEYVEDDEQPDKEHRTPWRLVVCEDSGEFLKARQRGDASAAMSRLLNFSDGIMGQGSNTIFLITTNEDFDKLDKAVTRPGRCLAQIEVGMFEPNEARQWLLRRGGCKNYYDPVTLAQLMADLNEVDRVVTGKAEPVTVGNYI